MITTGGNRMFISSLLLMLIASIVIMPASSAEKDWERLTAESFDLYQLKEYDEAIRVSREALAAARTEFGARHQVVGKSMNNLGAMLSQHGDPAEAELLLTGALGILEEKLGSDDPGTSSTLNNLAEFYSGQGRYDEAEPLFKRAIALREKEPGERHADLITSLDNLASLYVKMNRFRDAEHLYEMSLEIKEEYYRKEHPDSEAITNKIIQLYIHEGNYHKTHDDADAAATAYETALAMMKVLEDPDLPTMAALLDILTVMNIQSGEYEEAVFNYRKLMSIHAELHGERSVEYAESSRDLARLYVRMERYSDALPLYETTLDIQSEKLAADYPELIRSLKEQASAMTALANSYLKSGRTEDAVPLLARSIDIREKTGESGDPSLAIRMNNLAGLLAGLQRFKEAEQLYSRALDILRESREESRSDYFLVLGNMRQMYILAGESARAAEIDSILSGSGDGP